MKIPPPLTRRAFSKALTQTSESLNGLGLDRWLRIVEAAESRDRGGSTSDKGRGVRTAQSEESEISQGRPLDTAHGPAASSKNAAGQRKRWLVSSDLETDTLSEYELARLKQVKANHEVLIPAAWLHQADFNVVLFDLRDHGNSTVEDGLVSAGQREWRDVVAVWSWLQSEKGVPSASIGLYGVSLGAGTAAIAFDQERDIEAVFLESSFASMDKILAEELAFGGFPAFLKDAAVFAGKVSSGDNLVKHEPLSAAKHIGNRSMFITQSEEDYRIKLHHSQSLCDTAKANVGDSGHVECWFAPSSVAHEDSGEPGVLSHVTLFLKQKAAYENRLVQFFESSLATTDAVV